MGQGPFHRGEFPVGYRGSGAEGHLEVAHGYVKGVGRSPEDEAVVQGSPLGQGFQFHFHLQITSERGLRRDPRPPDEKLPGGPCEKVSVIHEPGVDLPGNLHRQRRGYQQKRKGIDRKRHRPTSV